MKRFKGKTKANVQKGEKKIKKVTLTQNDIAKLKKQVTEDATKKAILLVLSTCIDELSLSGEALEKLVERIDQRNGWITDERIIQLRDLASSIYNQTGVDFRSW